MPHQYSRTGKFDGRAEVYSFGVVLCELLTGRLQQDLDLVDAFGDLYDDDEKAAVAALSAKVDTRGGAWPAAAVSLLGDLALRCISHRPRDRPAAMVDVLQELTRVANAHLPRSPGELLLRAERDALQAELQALRGQQQQQGDARRQAEAAAAGRRRQCQVCFDEVDSSQGASCPNNPAHFLCGAAANACFEGEVLEQVGYEQLASFARENKRRIVCRACPAPRPALEDREVARLVGEAMWGKYRAAGERVVEGDLESQLERRYQVRLMEMRRELQQEQEQRSAVAQQRRHIVDKILTLACPRAGCGQAFVDFEGCLALTCARCKCAFCAYCLADCGKDAHRHVANCDQSLATGVHGSRAVFEEAQRRRRQRLLTAHLGSLQPALRGDVVKALERDLPALRLTA